MRNSKNKIIWRTFLFTVLLGGFLTLEAQKIEFGLRFMPAFTKFDVNTSKGGRIIGDVDLGYGVSAHLGYNFSDQVGLQTEIIYSSYAQKFKESDVEHDIKLKYINIPLLLALNTSKSKAFNLGIVAGPQIGLSVGSKLLSSNNETNGSVPILSVKKGDLGFAYGAGVDFGLDAASKVRLNLGFRGVYGLIDISDNSGTAETNSYYILDRTKIKVYSGYVGLSFLF